MKFTVSDAAKEQLAQYQGKSIRIFVEGVG